MLKICNVREEQRAAIPAVTHVGGTARLQTVHHETNPRYHRLLKEFERLSGVPVLLNTSLNVMGEPIVESPVDAVRLFFTTGLDYLVMGNYIIGKCSGELRRLESSSAASADTSSTGRSPAFTARGGRAGVAGTVTD